MHHSMRTVRSPENTNRIGKKRNQIKENRERKKRGQKGADNIRIDKMLSQSDEMKIQSAFYEPTDALSS